MQTMEEYANWGFHFMEDKLMDNPNYFFRETAFLEVFLAFDATVPESTDDAPEPLDSPHTKKFAVPLVQYRIFVGGMSWNQSSKSPSTISCHGKPLSATLVSNGSGSNSSTLNTPAPPHLPVSNIYAPVMAGTPVV